MSKHNFMTYMILISPLVMVVGGLLLYVTNYPLGIWGIIIIVVMAGFTRGIFRSKNENHKNSTFFMIALSTIVNTLILFLMIFNYMQLQYGDENPIIIILGSLVFTFMFKMTFHLISDMIGIIVTS